MRHKYAFLTITLPVILGLFVTAQYGSAWLMDHVNHGAYQRFLGGHFNYTPFETGLSWEMNIIYRKSLHMATTRNLVFLGSSTSREGIIEDRFPLPSGWTLHNFSLGGDSVYSFQILLNYLNKYSGHRLDKNDLVVVHIMHPNFVNEPARDSYLKKMIEFFGFYSVNDETLEISGSSNPWQRAFFL